MIAANVMRAGIVLTILALALASLCACAERRAHDPSTCPQSSILTHPESLQTP